METDECPCPPHSITEERNSTPHLTPIYTSMMILQPSPRTEVAIVEMKESSGSFRPAHDDSVLAGGAPLSLTEQVHQSQDRGWVRQLSWRPAAQLQESH